MGEIKLVSWNVNGIRSALRGGFQEWLGNDGAAIVCLQETKARPEQLEEDVRRPEGFHVYWNYPERKGYAGVAIFSKMKPQTVEYDLGRTSLDTEGRVIMAGYPGFTLFNIYFPNGKQSDERLRYKMEFYDVFLDYADSLRSAGKKLVICGDVNTAHQEIDLARPGPNSKLSGFLPEERAWLDKFVEHGYVDSFRHFNPEPDHYSYWDIKTGARERNVGWRIDYFFVSDDLLPSLKNAFIESEVMGSDHCPIGITLETA